MSKEEKDLPETLPRWEIPASWRWVSITDVGTVSTGNTPPTKEIDNYGNFIPFVKPPELRDRGVWEASDGLSEKGVKFSRTLPAGAVLVSCIGGLGKTGLAKIPVAFNQQINAIVFDVNVLPEFGFYYMQTLKPWLYEVSSATTLPIVNKGKFLRAPFPLAPLKDQKLIVAEIEKQFSRLDEAVVSLKRIQANLKRYEAAVLKAAVEGKLTEQWRKDHAGVEPADQLLKRILAERHAKWEAEELAKMKAKGTKPKDDLWKKKYKEPAGPDTANLPELPEGWVWATYEQVSLRVTVGHVGSMKYEYKETGVPFLRSQNVRENRFDPDGLKFISNEFHESLKKSALEPGDLVVVRSGSVGVACVVPDHLKEANCSDLVIVKKTIGILPEFGAFYMNSNAKKQVKAQQVGVALIHFNTQSMAEMPIPVPSAKEQCIIIEEVSRRLSVTEELEATIETNLKRAERLRQTILQRAFSGGLV